MRLGLRSTVDAQSKDDDARCVVDGEVRSRMSLVRSANSTEETVQLSEVGQQLGGLGAARVCSRERLGKPLTGCCEVR